MLPTIWIDFMWHSGISGSLVNMIAYVAAAYFLFKLVIEITGSKLNATIAYLALALNINILYFQATPMTEMLFISTLIVSLFYFYDWQNTKQISSLLLSAIFFFLASLTRYEGWFVVVGAIISVVLISLRRFGRKKAEGYAILFGTLASSGIMLWLLWQFVIFGHPFDFLRNEFAAGVNTARDIEAGLVPTYKNLSISVLTQIYAVAHTSGVIATVLSASALFIFIVRTKLKIFEPRNFVFYIALIPFFFEILALYQGNIPVYVPEIKIKQLIPEFLNVRYALYSVPAIAIFIATMSNRKTILAILTFFVMLNNTSLLPILGGSVVALEGVETLDFQNNPELREWTRWLSNNYDGGLILVSVASSDAFIFKTGLDMKMFISEGSGKYWKESMKNPSSYARWVLIRDSGRDSLLRHLNMDALNRQFDLQNEAGGYRFYKIKDKPGIREIGL